MDNIDRDVIQLSDEATSNLVVSMLGSNLFDDVKFITDFLSISLQYLIFKLCKYFRL